MRGDVEHRGPGRPRDDGLDERLLTATLGLIDAGEPVTVGRITARSGVSRAAIYRRWPTVTDLVAAALDRGREPIEVPLDGDLRENLMGAVFGVGETAGARYPEERMRQRLMLALADRTLQKAYFDAHVARRRVAMATALRAGIDRGILRPDIDIDACLDLMAGVFYYQLVVRGDPVRDDDVLARCRSALDVVWRGMAVDP